jgi:uncharacterized protein (TIGR02246 family)
MKYVKCILLAAAMVLISPSIAFGQASDNQITRISSDEQAVREVEDEIVAAIDHNDADALDRHCSPDYTFVNPAGQVWTREKYLQLMRSGALKVDSYSRDEQTVRIYGNTAVVIYRSTARGDLKGQTFSSQRRVTTVLMKENGRWLAITRQSTPIIQPK